MLSLGSSPKNPVTDDISLSWDGQDRERWGLHPADWMGTERRKTGGEKGEPGRKYAESKNYPFGEWSWGGNRKLKLTYVQSCLSVPKVKKFDLKKFPLKSFCFHSIGLSTQSRGQSQRLALV